jgi:hypothetical protein
VEWTTYLKSRGKPIGSRNVAQHKAVLQEWMTRPAGPPHCMFKALFANMAGRTLNDLATVAMKTKVIAGHGILVVLITPCSSDCFLK